MTDHPADTVATDRTQVIHGNALSLPLPDASVDLVVTSPPYFALRSYRDGDEHYDGQIGSEATPQEFLESLWAATGEMIRVLKPSGSIWVNLGDKYAGSGGHNNSGVSGGPSQSQGASQRKVPVEKAARRDAPNHYNQSATFEIGRRVDKGEQRYVKGEVPKKSLMGLPWRYAIGCVDQLGLILRAEVIWSKPNGLPESVTDRVRRSHETWFHMVKQRDYFSATDDIREAHVEPQRPHVLTWDERKGRDDPAARYSDQNGHGGTAGMAQNPLGRMPGSVWTIASEPLIIPEAVQAHLGLPDHFAAFPTEWPRRIILGWSPPGGVVLDPFGGTGTTAMVARALDRIGIHVDRSADYCRLAEWRIFQSGHGAKAESRTWADRQGEMFGGAA